MISSIPATDAAPRLLPTVEISLPGLPGYEKVARDAAAAVAVQMGFSLDRVEDLKTALAEACLNAMEHGNAGEDCSHVQVVLRVEEASLQVSVSDRGTAPLPDPLPPPGLPDRTRGWGLFFISALMDEVAFHRLPEGGNQVSMVIRMRAPEAAVAAAEVPAQASVPEAEAAAATVPAAGGISVNGVCLDDTPPPEAQEGEGHADTPPGAASV